MNDAIEEIRSDFTSGALDITLKAAEALKQSIGSTGFANTAEMVDHVLKVSREVYRARPAMASLANLAGRTLAGAETGETVEEGVTEAVSNIDGFVELMKENAAMVAEHAASFIEDGGSIMTISNSSAVWDAVIKARDQGKCFKVCCLESRPMLEGVMLAERLTEAGVDTLLLTDSSAFMFMEEMSVAMVGGDSLTPQGLVNKVGTRGLAMAAEKLGVPFYALCSTEKLLPMGLGYEPKLDLYDPRQILQQPPENLEIVNCYFDITPLDQLTGVITEKGLIHGDYLMEHLSALPTRGHVAEILQI
jgi:translation initiation factor 2B subunit (eIF-2B alpha/beta/delta family)